jgi:hypothetical protein
LQLIECSGICRSTTSKTEGTSTGAVDIARTGTVAPDHQDDAESEGDRVDSVQVERQGEGEVCEELRKEELEQLLAKKAVIQEMIDDLLK